MTTIKLNIPDKKHGRTLNKPLRCLRRICSDDNPEMPETSKKKVALSKLKLSATIIGAIELSETPYSSQEACLCKSEAHINTYLHYGAVTANRARLWEPHSIQTTAMTVNF